MAVLALNNLILYRVVFKNFFSVVGYYFLAQEKNLGSLFKSNLINIFTVGWLLDYVSPDLPPPKPLDQSNESAPISAQKIIEFYWRSAASNFQFCRHCVTAIDQKSNLYSHSKAIEKYPFMVDPNYVMRTNCAPPPPSATFFSQCPSRRNSSLNLSKYYDSQTYRQTNIE